MQKTIDPAPVTGRLSAPPVRRGLLAAKAAACARCQACPLYRNATQAVFGEGRAGAAVMLVGEQPGDAEDLVGRPFVGPAGMLLDAAIREAGLQRGDVYVTNAVKHFNFEQRGKHRLHKKPGAGDVRACRPWLLDEITIVRPHVIVALGATAAASMFGPSVKLTRDRGHALEAATPIDGAAPSALHLVTFHPAAVLRAPTSERRAELRALLTSDLALAGRLAGKSRGPSPS
jgi:uracil-DNA glycosylase family protein